VNGEYVNVELSPRDRGPGHVIKLDGHDVAPYVTRMDLVMEAGETPVLTLRMVQPSVLINARAVVELDEGTAAFLQSLGWTPPGGAGSYLDAKDDGS